MVCRLRQTFGYTLDQIMIELPLDQAFAESAWAFENDAITRAFGGIKRVGRGYIGVETDRLMEMLK